MVTHVIVTTTENGDQDEILMAHACSAGNCVVCVDLDTIKIIGWLLAARRQSQSAEWQPEKIGCLPAYNAGCTKDDRVNVCCQDSINDATLIKSGQLSLSFARSLGETV